MRDFEGNSNIGKKSKEKPKIEPITKNVSVKKETEFKKFKKNFFSEDARTVKSQVFTDVIIPGIQRLITDMVKTGIDVLIYGRRTNTDRNSRVGNISYTSYYDRNRAVPVPQSSYSKNNAYSFNDVVLFDRGEAEEVLLSLRDQIDRYGMVSVADFYDMIGQSSPYTANKYGWRDLRDASVGRVRDGYSISFPKAVPLE